jgi:hypothetical protein
MAPSEPAAIRVPQSPACPPFHPGQPGHRRRRPGSVAARRRRSTTWSTPSSSGIEEVELPAEGEAPGFRLRREEGLAVRLVRAAGPGSRRATSIAPEAFAEALRQVARALPVGPLPGAPSRPRPLARGAAAEELASSRSRWPGRSAPTTWPSPCASRSAATAGRCRWWVRAWCPGPRSRPSTASPPSFPGGAGEPSCRAGGRPRRRRGGRRGRWSSASGAATPAARGRTEAWWCFPRRPRRCSSTRRWPTPSRPTPWPSGHPEAAVGVTMGPRVALVLDDPGSAPEGPPPDRRRGRRGLPALAPALRRGRAAARRPLWARGSDVLAREPAAGRAATSPPGPAVDPPGAPPREAAADDLRGRRRWRFPRPQVVPRHPRPRDRPLRAGGALRPAHPAGHPGGPGGAASASWAAAGPTSRVAAVGREARPGGAGWCAKGGRKLPVWATAPALRLEGCRGGRVSGALGEVLAALAARGLPVAEVYAKRGRSRVVEEGPAGVSVSYLREEGWAARAGDDRRSLFAAGTGPPDPAGPGGSWPEADGDALALPDPGALDLGAAPPWRDPSDFDAPPDRRARGTAAPLEPPGGAPGRAPGGAAALAPPAGRRLERVGDLAQQPRRPARAREPHRHPVPGGGRPGEPPARRQPLRRPPASPGSSTPRPWPAAWRTASR